MVKVRDLFLVVLFDISPGAVTGTPNIIFLRNQLFLECETFELGMEILKITTVFLVPYVEVTPPPFANQNTLT